MKTIKVVLLNVFVLLFILSNYNCGDNGTSIDGKTVTVSGVVTYESGKPVDSALVTLFKFDFGSSNGVSTYTNSYGQYSISNYFDNAQIRLNLTKWVKDSLGILQNYNVLYIVVPWRDEPQVINIRVKQN